MDPLSQIALLLINTACSVFLMLVWLRFLLQASGADFYNPMSQFVVKATSPILHPLRRVIPALLAVTTLFSLLLAASSFFFWLILLMVILSWVSMASGGVSPALMPVFQLSEFILAPCRRLLPSMGGFDLSPIIAFLAIQIFEILVKSAYPTALALVGAG